MKHTFRTVGWAGALMGAALAGGCLGPPALFQDSWEAHAQPGNALTPAREVPCWSVRQDRQAQAQKMLETAAFVAVTEEQARELAGMELPDRQAGGAYLVRAVYLWNPTYRASIAGGRLDVGSYTLGVQTVWKPRRAALLIRLPAPPKQVNVTYHVAV